MNGWTALQDDDMRNQDWPKSTLMHDGFDDDGGGDDGDDYDDGDDHFCKMVDDDDVLEDAWCGKSTVTQIDFATSSLGIAGGPTIKS